MFWKIFKYGRCPRAIPLFALLADPLAECPHQIASFTGWGGNRPESDRMTDAAFGSAPPGEPQRDTPGVEPRRPFNERHPILAGATAVSLICGSLLALIWTFTAGQVGDTDLTVDIGLAVGGTGALVGFVGGALGELALRRWRR
jgi:hypothetical protein